MHLGISAAFRSWKLCLVMAVVMPMMSASWKASLPIM